MKKLCFVEFEGLLESYGNYAVSKEKVKQFFEKLNDFCKYNKIDLYVISGFHENIALSKFKASFVSKLIPSNHFFFVSEEYISSKHEIDEKLHRDNLSKDENFNDSFFKQTIISKIVAEKQIDKSDALLLCDDIWVDGYYTTKFSKIDFALFENNLNDRGKRIDKILGLIYFNFDFDLVKNLLIDFPKTDLSNLDKFVFNKMKEVIMKDVDLTKLKDKINDRGNSNVSQ